jgi:phage gp45-like
MINAIKLVKVLFARTSGLLQTVKCSFLGRTQDLKVLNMYGISFCPPANSFGVAISANGYTDEAFVVCDKPDKRFTGLQPGELKVGNYVTGAYIYFKEDGSIEVSAPNVKIVATTKVEITSPLVEVTGTVEAADFITSAVPSYNAHSHSGVTTGLANTGGPNP